MQRSWSRVASAFVVLASSWTLSSSAVAQTNCNATVGPDVIVGDIQSIANYSSLNGVEALALGTYSCNIGTVWVSWISGNNLHPAIGSTLYRYSVVEGAGRFEQLGMSWLKHGFYALSNTLCCTGCAATDGTHLGVHCSDPYTASRNGSQSGLGPRWEVNAANGVFTYPPSSPPYSGSIARRLQVNITDLEAPGPQTHTRYFGEAQYVTQDDAAAGNNDNNASYRELTVSGSGSAWNFALTGTTVRETPAILAWKDIDPDVQISDFHVPGEGRMILASRVTSLGSGRYHYEYALFNLNSDIGAGSFSVPFTANAMVYEQSFHDVDYHDGDGPGGVTRDGTHWSATAAAGVVAWNTDSFAQNPNANALRWSATMNFRFDSDASPIPGNATIGLFKTGGTLQVAAPVPGHLHTGLAFCFADGNDPSVSIPCPCGSVAAEGRGCPNSFELLGAILWATGATATDTLTLTTGGQPLQSVSILLQGDASAAGGTSFGDGIRCAGGTLRVLAITGARSGSSSFPLPGGPSISALATTAGDVLTTGATRVYQIYYRDTDPSFCPATLGADFNATNALQVTW